MGVVVDFIDDLSVMLDELQETYNGRILSPQGKIIRVMPVSRKREIGDGRWEYYGQVYITTLIDSTILLARLETDHGHGAEKGGDARAEADLELERLTREAELMIEDRGFILKRGRYYFAGDDDYHKELIEV